MTFQITECANCDELDATVLQLRAALTAAVEVIKTWHNMPGAVRLPDSVMEETWRIYYKNAPEMKTIREAEQEQHMGDLARGASGVRPDTQATAKWPDDFDCGFKHAMRIVSKQPSFEAAIASLYRELRANSSGDAPRSEQDRDAKRYRFLKENACGATLGVWEVETGFLKPSEIDGILDAAMSSPAERKE